MSERSDDRADTRDREIVIERMLEAPRELAFEAWTNADHLERWWGPRGFTVTTHAFEFAPGASWRFTMHGPDGTDYANLIKYREIVRPERIAYSNHGGDADGPALFHTTVSFVADGERTRLTMRSVFPTAAARDFVIEKHRAVEGGKQTMARLASQLAGQRRVHVFRVARVFDAPRTRVFDAWSRAEHVRQWFAPDGFSMPECTVDLRTGGVFRFVFRDPGGGDHLFDGSFAEVVPGERIVFEGTIHEGLEAITTVRFEDEGGKTRLEVEQVYSTASPATQGAPIGWGQTLDHLAAFVARR